MARYGRDLQTFLDTVADELGLGAFGVYAHGNILNLHMITVPKANQNQGLGTTAMLALCEYADGLGKTITLTPAKRGDPGTRGANVHTRLVRFYKRFGFVENKGRNADFSISAEMYRAPQPTTLAIFRGESTGNRGGSYWATDREWARQFTQSGLDREIKTAWIDPARVYRRDPLPHASGPDGTAWDNAAWETRRQGLAAFWVDEGMGEPESIFVLNKSALRRTP